MRDRRFIESLDESLKHLRNRVVAILTHAGGDPDSIGASYALMNLLKKKYGATETIFTIPSQPSTHSKTLLAYLDLKLGDPRGADFFIVIDTGSPEQLSEYEWVLSEPEKIMVIDHHTTSVESFGSEIKTYSSEKYQSVCEIVQDLMELTQYKPNKLEAEAIFIGIYYDTLRLSVADDVTLRKLCEVAETGIRPVDILSKLETKINPSERIARLKAASRMKLYRFRGWLVALTRVGSFQSSCARALIGLGAHVGIAAGESDDGVEVSMRASKEFIEETGLDLGRDLAAKIGRDFMGHGGGHPAAARAYCAERDVEKVLSRCLELLSESLNSPAELMRP